MRVRVDRDKCIGAGQCVLNAPSVFDQDEQGLSVVLAPRPPLDERTAITDAAAACPVRAIDFARED